MNKMQPSWNKYREEFERNLALGSKSYTVSDALSAFKESQIVKLLKLSDVRSRLEDPSFNVLASFKDGLALKTSRLYPNRAGINFYYFLHRNGEEMIYSIGEIGINFADCLTSEKPRISSLSLPY